MAHLPLRSNLTLVDPPAGCIDLYRVFSVDHIHTPYDKPGENLKVLAMNADAKETEQEL